MRFVLIQFWCLHMANEAVPRETHITQRGLHTRCVRLHCAFRVAALISKTFLTSVACQVQVLVTALPMAASAPDISPVVKSTYRVRTTQPHV